MIMRPSIRFTGAAPWLCVYAGAGAPTHAGDLAAGAGSPEPAGAGAGAGAGATDAGAGGPARAGGEAGESQQGGLLFPESGASHQPGLMVAGAAAVADGGDGGGGRPRQGALLLGSCSQARPGGLGSSSQGENPAQVQVRAGGVGIQTGWLRLPCAHGEWGFACACACARMCVCVFERLRMCAPSMPMLKCHGCAATMCAAPGRLRQPPPAFAAGRAPHLEPCKALSAPPRAILLHSKQQQQQ